MYYWIEINTCNYECRAPMSWLIYEMIYLRNISLINSKYNIVICYYKNQMGFISICQTDHYLLGK